MIHLHESERAVHGMPKAVIDEQLADRIVPIGGIAGAIVNQLRSSSAPAPDS